MNRLIRTVAVLTAAAFALAGCASGSNTPGDTAASTSGTTTAAGEPTTELTTLKIGASPVPHAEILQFVQDNLAAAAGLNLEIVEFDDYVLPNTSLAEGELDANYFQHLPYYTSQVKEHGFDFDHFEGVHIEPYGLYSSKVDSVDAIPDGGTFGITNDPGNQARALDLLVKAGLITLKSTDADPTLLDIATNSKNLTFVETAPEQLVRSLDDVDAAIINGNYALEAGLNPAKDSLFLESGENNPYANFLAVRAEDKTNPAIVKLDELLHSDEVRAFIQQRWPDGEVIPAF